MYDECRSEKAEALVEAALGGLVAVGADVLYSLFGSHLFLGDMAGDETMGGNPTNGGQY